MIPSVIIRPLIQALGYLYPAFLSFKAIRDKNTREYVHWMMYWIVFAFFNCLEPLADMIIGCWLPFYQEAKLLFVIWLFAPITRGSSFLYRSLVHPRLLERAEVIDERLDYFQQQGVHALTRMKAKCVQHMSAAVVDVTSRLVSTVRVAPRLRSALTASSMQMLPVPTAEGSAMEMEVDAAGEGALVAAEVNQNQVMVLSDSEAEEEEQPAARPAGSFTQRQGSIPATRSGSFEREFYPSELRLQLSSAEDETQDEDDQPAARPAARKAASRQTRNRTRATANRELKTKENTRRTRRK
jgi:receptor expression-enhancing protein 1/2/3/4